MLHSVSVNSRTHSIQYIARCTMMSVSHSFRSVARKFLLYDLMLRYYVGRNLCGGCRAQWLRMLQVVLQFDANVLYSGCILDFTPFGLLPSVHSVTGSSRMRIFIARPRLVFLSLLLRALLGEHCAIHL